jgi:hypothetical protein
LDHWGSVVRLSAEAEDFFLSTVSMVTLRPTSPPIQWVSRLCSQWRSSQDLQLTTHLNLVPKLKQMELCLHPTCLHSVHSNNLTFICLQVSVYRHNFLLPDSEKVNCICCCYILIKESHLIILEQIQQLPISGWRLTCFWNDNTFLYIKIWNCKINIQANCIGN